MSYPATVEKLGIRLNDNQGGQVKLALYTDGGDGPETLVAKTGAVAVTAGDVEIAVDSPTQLPVGDYYVMFVSDEGLEFQAGNSQSVTQRYIEHLVTEPFPDTHRGGPSPRGRA